VDTNAFKELWAQRSFMRYWGYRITTTCANQMMMVALGWQMYETTQSAWDFSCALCAYCQTISNGQP
jgi:hypothetical protein